MAGQAKMIPLILEVFLLLSRVLALKIEFANARSFYHDLTSEAQQFILHLTNLDDVATISIQDSLLADPLFNIAWLYNCGCHRIELARARKLARLAKAHGKDFEQRWLSTACLSPRIVQARKEIGEWPPRSIPLLIKGLSFVGLQNQEIDQLLRSSLEHPEWWYASILTYQLNLKDLSLDLWRIVALEDSTSIWVWREQLATYLQASIFQKVRYSTRSRVEEFFIKVIRIIPFLKNPTYYIDVGSLLGKIGNLISKIKAKRSKDSWTKVLLGVISQLGVDHFEQDSFLNTLLESHPLSLDFWRDKIDKTTATNDIIELFILAITLSNTTHHRNAIKTRLQSFLSNLEASFVTPIRVRELAMKLSKCRLQGPGITWYLSQLTKDDRLWSVLHDLVPTATKKLEALRHTFKLNVTPLLERFWQIERRIPHGCNTYVQRLYQIWQRDKPNWPGINAAHGQLKEGLNIAGYFEREKSDPKIDLRHSISTWKSIFLCFDFGVQHDIPNKTVPSLCSIKALLYFGGKFGKGIWEELQQRTGTLCSFPLSKRRRHNYKAFLRGAVKGLADLLFFMPWIDAETLYAGLSGYILRDTNAIDYSTDGAYNI